MSGRRRGARLLDRGRGLSAGLSDYVIVVRGKTKIFLAGPPLLKAATGEISTDEELGGAEMHATVSGLGEWMAEDDPTPSGWRARMAKLEWDRIGAPPPRRRRLRPRGNPRHRAARLSQAP